MKVLGASTVLALPGASQGEPSGTLESIIELDRQLNQFIVNHDVDGASRLYDDEFILTVAGSGLKTKKDMLADIGNPTLSLTVCKTVEVSVRLRGSTAVLIGVLLQAGTLSGRTFDVRLRVTDTWTLAPDGQWKLLAGHASQDRATA